MGPPRASDEHAASGGRECGLDGVGQGFVLAGRYRLEERLQADLRGSQWRAVDQTLERQVVVRALDASNPQADDIVDAARRAALAEDPRLVRILDVGSQSTPVGHVTYIVSEHVNGRALADVVAAAPLPAETARRLVGEAAQALARAGSRGLHHLRLDPGSVWITSDGSVKLSGTAIEASVAGVEPETSQAAERVDSVGLVSILYAAITGRWPGAGSSRLGVAPLVNGRPVGPGDLVAGIPNDLDTLCTVTLGPHDDGPRSPAELAEQLAPWARSAQLTDPRGLTLTGPNRPAPRPAQRSTQQPGRPALRPGARQAESARAGGLPASPRHPRRPDAPPVRPAAAATSASAPAVVVTPPTGRAPASPTPPAVPASPAAPASLRPAPLPPQPASPAPASPLTTSPATASPAPASPLPAAQPPAAAPPAPPAAPPPTSPPPAAAPPAGRNGDRPDQVDDLFRPASDTGSGYDDRRRGIEPPDLDAPFGVVGTAGRSGPWTGFGRPSDGEEYLGPFLPPAPLTRPTDDQSRLVLVVVAVVVVVGLGVALWSLRDFGAGSDGVLPTPSASTVAPTASPTASPSASASVSAPPPAVKPVVAGLRALDPLGDQEENDGLVSRAFDSDPGTAWRSSRYKTQLFGGLKDGLGIAVQLEEPAPVTEVTVDSQGSDGIVELRINTEPTFDGSNVVATGTVQDGKVVLRPTRPVTTEFLLLWVTRLPQVDGQGQMFVSEITLK